LTEIEQEWPPLRGIIHAAGVLDDGVLQKQGWERFAQVLAPKVAGAWSLHRLTKGSPLDFFVAFSSVASLLGSAGQGNYSAANAFLDQLAHYRQALGLPGLSIDWGPWAGIGLAARMPEGKQPSEMRFLAPEQGLAVLEALLDESMAQVGVVRIDWQLSTGLKTGSKFLEDLTHKDALSSETEPVEAVSQERLEQMSAPERRAYLQEEIRSGVVKVMGLDADQAVDPERPLAELGIDSLMTLELRVHLGSRLGCQLPTALVFDNPSISSLARYIDNEVLRPGNSSGQQLGFVARIRRVLERARRSRPES
jgi:myxalamid-type polyketide synthase MxaB